MSKDLTTVIDNAPLRRDTAAPMILPGVVFERGEVDGFLHGVAWILAENGTSRDRIKQILKGPAVKRAKELWPDFDMKKS